MLIIGTQIAKPKAGETGFKLDARNSLLLTPQRHGTTPPPTPRKKRTNIGHL